MILAIQATTSGGGSHLYCPLHRSEGPSVDPLDLPIRTHAETLRQGYNALQAPNDTARSNLATDCGVKGVSLLARLSSMNIPASFPVEIMHMVWINLIPQLAELWTQQFNGLDDGVESYAINSLLWNSIVYCGVLVTLGTQLAPNLLRRQFSKSKYYVHFVQLINLMKEVTDRSLKRSALPRLREGFAFWVQDYEKYYYQYNKDRMQTCPVNVHYLLHIVDSIEYLGPVWGYWAFPMERYCSFVGASVKSRRYPYTNIANRIRDVAHLRIIREIYNFQDTVTFSHTRASKEEEELRNGEIGNAELLPDYPGLLLLTPHTESLVVNTEIANKIAKHLSTIYGVTIPVAKSFIPDSLKQWGRVCIGNGGDLIHARGYHKLRSDGRDASFVRYVLLVDRRAHQWNAPEDMVQKSHYGQLWRLMALPLEPNTAINPHPRAQTLLLALILEAKAREETTYQYKVVWYEGNLSTGEVVDAETIQSSELAHPDIV
ncbi:hypothetical protein BDV93DRAFT_513593 [Ceratobasidium sp. AG-I]|nr:hypothetical protein BDV93DRAFT_513593 [Ceratobasidium sp. AG-I]